MSFRLLAASFVACGDPTPPFVEDTTPIEPIEPVSPPDDSDTTEPQTYSGEPLGNVGARQHETIGSIVYATWDQSAAGDVWVEYSFDDGEWLSTPLRSDVGPGAHEQILLGIPYSETVTFRVVFEGQGSSFASDEVTTTVGPLPAGVPDTNLISSDPGRLDAAPYVFVSVGQFFDDFWTVIVDREGRYVWVMESPRFRVAMHPRVAADERSLYIDLNSYWAIFDGGDAAEVVQLLIDGTRLHTFETPGLHHPFTDLPDGSLAWGATTGGYGNEFLKIVDVAGNEETIFDCEDWLDTIGEGGEFCMSNTLTYHEPTNKFLFSMFSFESILEIDRATGEVDRWFGHVNGVWDFAPANSAFWWQHGAYITPTGTLLTSSDVSSGGVETVIREYEFDDANDTLVEVWNFGIGEGVYGVQMGDAFRLSNGNTLHNYGEASRLREATPDKSVVWDLDFDSDDMGRSMPISDLYALAPEMP